MKAIAPPDSAVALATSRRAPRFFYGWVMLPIAMLGLIATSPGQTFGVSIFTEAIRTGLSLSNSQFAAAYTLGTLAAAFPLAYVGGLMDRYGLRRTMIVTVLLFGTACLVLSIAVNWVMLFGAFFLLRLLGPGSLSLLSANTLAFWFRRRLGLVEGVRAVGMAVAMAVIPAVNLFLLAQFGWRSAYAVLGVSVWLIMLPLLLVLFRNRPEDVGQTLDGLPPEESDAEARRTTDVPSLTLPEALRTPAFWIVTGGTATFGMVYTGLFFFIVPVLLEQGGSKESVATLMTVFAASLATMQFLGGVLADHLPARLLLPLALGLLAGGMFGLAHSTPGLLVYGCGIALGAGQGLYFSTSNPLWARYFGLLHLGKIRGMLSTLNVGSSSLGPLVFGFARDMTGSYTLVLLCSALFPLPLLLLSCFTNPPKKPSGR